MSPEQLAGSLEDWLDSAGIHLTMGGEPTFLPALPEAPEWNTEAMGAEKLGYARRMAGELVDKVFPGALVMQVFGKWYPSEPLPRWNLLTMARKDGQAIWADRNRFLLDDVEGENDPKVSYLLADLLSRRLKLKRFLLEAVEGPAATQSSGWVLPLVWSDGKWSSSNWPYTRKRPIPLVEGDSPIGLRLPLDELPKDLPRTALTIEVSKGSLEIFLPPLEWEAFQVLMDLIQEIAEEMDLRDIVLCGYAPTSERGFLVCTGLAADPGVLEVNLPPCSSWEEYDRILGQCADAAEEVDLHLTKYQLNGSIFGTGGGNHLAFAGPSLDENPFLQDSKRITSIVRYWQHHPSLSYLFSGQYVGTGCQAPRTDEGPSHSLYETEVACEGMEQLKTAATGELVDQFLKNLMTDAGGNTHRAELCFDKFFNTGQPNGCLGLIEFRAFETFQSSGIMSLIALFIRAILTRLFKEPFQEPLVRHGPTLHDRYMLPAFLWKDLVAICRDLKRHGFPFDPQWLKDAWEFRCPLIGTIELPVGSVEVRRALEPWPLMAEESLGSSTVRVVDNSSDRIQVELANPELLEEGKLLVNGIEVPFRKVGKSLICGIRYKCASAYPALHPHVPIQSPLCFEWVENKKGRTTAASFYHYWNPRSSTYRGRPRTTKEAAKRRDERWIAGGDLIGRKPEPVAAKVSDEYRYTLDLRRHLGG